MNVLTISCISRISDNLLGKEKKKIPNIHLTPCQKTIFQDELGCVRVEYTDEHEIHVKSFDSHPCDTCEAKVM